jgi:hypothetical protein
MGELVSWIVDNQPAIQLTNSRRGHALAAAVCLRAAPAVPA